MRHTLVYQYIPIVCSVNRLLCSRVVAAVWLCTIGEELMFHLRQERVYVIEIR